jgi:hypothetical protein
MFHFTLCQRIRDACETNHLQMMGSRALKFISNQITLGPGECVEQIRMAFAVDRVNTQQLLASGCSGPI